MSPSDRVKAVTEAILGFRWVDEGRGDMRGFCDDAYMGIVSRSRPGIWKATALRLGVHTARFDTLEEAKRCIEMAWERSRE